MIAILIQNYTFTSRQIVLTFIIYENMLEANKQLFFDRFTFTFYIFQSIGYYQFF